MKETAIESHLRSGKLGFGAILLFASLLLSNGLFAQQSPSITLFGAKNDYRSAGYNDCWGYTAPDGREYAILGVRNGTSFIDITNSELNEIAFFSSATSTWKDIKTYQNYAYSITDASGGLQIFDLSNLPNSVELAATYSGLNNSHNLYIDEANAMLYAESSGSSPVRAFSLADPENPVQVSAFGVACHDIYARDNIVYVSEGSRGSIGVYDLSNPASPSLVGRFQIPKSGYVHNAWLSEDGNYLSTTEETTGKTVKHWDIRDLNNVVLTDEYLAPGRLAHNTHLRGGYAWVSHYGDGLRVLNTSNPHHVYEAGYFDAGGSSSAWGAFPFFSSGKVLISDISSGLYVVQFDENGVNDISLTMTPDNLPIVIPAGGGSFDYTIEVTNNTNSSRAVDVWTYALRLNKDTKTDNLYSNQNIQVGANQTVTLNITQTVPNIDPAQFTYFAKAGDLAVRPLAGDSFQFQALGPVRARRGKGSIENTQGWEAYLNDGVAQNVEIPESIVLEQSYPNPFNPSTMINYKLDKGSHVKLTVYNTLGQEVNTLVDEFKATGLHSISWNGSNAIGEPVAAGVYIYRLVAGDVVLARKMTFAK